MTIPPVLAAALVIGAWSVARADDPPDDDPDAPEPAAEPAAAPEPAAEPAPAPKPAPAPYEVIVYGELEVAKARQAIVDRLAELGYDTEVLDRGNKTVYRHDNAWYGEVVLYDDGWVQVKRQPLRVEGRQMPWAKRNTPVAWAGCLIWPWLCLRSTGATYGERKWRSRETATVDGIAPKVLVYGDKVADLATSRTIDTLPDRLTALWERGTPLDDAHAPLATYDRRRRALYEYWVTRTDTSWGWAVREAVEAFCRAIVQTSDHPFTPNELQALAAENPELPFLALPTDAEASP